VAVQVAVAAKVAVAVALADLESHVVVDILQVQKVQELHQYRLRLQVIQYLSVAVELVFQDQVAEILGEILLLILLHLLVVVEEDQVVEIPKMNQELLVVLVAVEVVDQLMLVVQEILLLLVLHKETLGDLLRQKVVQL
jgi:hypothetical protein